MKCYDKVVNYRGFQINVHRYSFPENNVECTLWKGDNIIKQFPKLKTKANGLRVVKKYIAKRFKVRI